VNARADVVIIGAGIIGASVAYHLAQARALEVVVVEQHSPAAGTTGKSVAVLEFQHATRRAIVLRQRSLAVYRRFFEDADAGVRWHRIGGLRLASTPAEAVRLRRAMRRQRRLGIAAEWLKPDQLQARLPALRVEDLAGATYCPEEGYVDPYRLVMALLRQAQRQGVRVYTDTAVTGIAVERGRVRGVQTTRGRIAARWVVNAAGPWAGRVAALAGVDVPLAHTKCQILPVRPQPPWPYAVPWLLDRHSGFYLRGETTGLVLLGRLIHTYDGAQIFDPDAYVGVGPRPDQAFMEFIAAQARWRVPALDRGQVLHGWAGLRAVTPDGRPLLGETSVAGFLLAAGFGGYGIQLGAVAGELLAELILEGTAPERLRPWAPHRFGRQGTP
jgi:sarcosine oxidase subunit beta